MGRNGTERPRRHDCGMIASGRRSKPPHGGSRPHVPLRVDAGGRLCRNPGSNSSKKNISLMPVHVNRCKHRATAFAF